MRWVFLAIMLGGCGADPAPANDANDSADSTDDSGTGETGDSGADEASITHGGDIVASVCNRCHGLGNPLASRIAGLDDDEIASVIRNGSGNMPPQDLDDGEIADVIAYLRVTYPE